MTLKKLTLSTFLFALSTSVIADEITPPGFYIGAGYGSFGYDTEEDWNNSTEYGVLIEETNGHSLKLYGGYQFNKVIAVEATYTDYGNTQGYVNTTSGLASVKQSPTSFSLAANLGYSFKNGIRPFGLIGLSATTLNSSYAFLEDDNITAIKMGLGVEFSPRQLHGIQFRLAYESDAYFAQEKVSTYNSDNLYIFTLDSFYAGVSYKF